MSYICCHAINLYIHVIYLLPCLAVNLYIYAYYFVPQHFTERVLLCVRHLLYDSCTTLALRRPTHPAVGLTKWNAAHPPFDSTSYTRRMKIVVRIAFPLLKTSSTKAICIGAVLITRFSVLGLTK
jgi:hypothetical protein